jgi:dihydroorotate dehydrogenase electron transfer subunit
LDLHIEFNPHRIVTLRAVKTETPAVKSLHFKDHRCAAAKPGQYIMLWVFGVDEVPMSLSLLGSDNLCGVTVERVGEATNALHRLKKGDSVGIRGPFGNSFTLTGRRCMFVAGGVGLAPLLPLAEQLCKLNKDIFLVYGGRTKSALFGLNRIRTIFGKNLTVVTEDGTLGITGLCTTVAAQMLEDKHFDMIYTCGPEPMMRTLFELTEQIGIPIEACVERIIKCSVGLCGSCMIGRYRVCKNGLILSSEQLREVRDEFGIYSRGFDGRPKRF